MFFLNFFTIQGTWERKLYDRVHNMKRKHTSQDEEEGNWRVGASV